MNQLKTTILGILLCLAISLVLFPLTYYISLPYYDKFGGTIDFAVDLLRIILCCLGGAFLYYLRYGKNQYKKSFNQRIRCFFRSYGLIFIILLLLWIVYKCFWDIQPYLSYYILNGADTLPEYSNAPWLRVFISENILRFSALLAYILFAGAYCWRKTAHV